MLPLCLAADNLFTLSDRTEARLREPDLVTGGVGLDLDTLVDARAVWTSPRWTYTLENTPHLTWLDYNGPASQLAPSDGLLAAAEWRSLRARIRLAESATYGQLSYESLTNLSAPGTTPGAPVQGQQTQVTPASPVAKGNPVYLFESSETSAISTLELRPWTLIAEVAYRLSGGANRDAQAVLPFSQGPFGQATADLVFDRDHDHLLTIATASESSFSGGPFVNGEDVVAGIEEQWRHRWARRTESWLGVGWDALRTRTGPTAPDVFASSPVAEAAIDQLFRRGLTLGELLFDVRLAPLLNPLTGVVDEQIRGTVEGKWSRRPWGVRMFASVGESVNQDTNYAVRLATAEVDAAYTVSRTCIVDGGIRALYESQNAPVASQGAFTVGQVVLFLAVNVQVLKVKL